MRIRKIVFLLSITLYSYYASAQSINDTIFKNVVLIEKDDVIKDSNNYLIDVVFDLKKLPIIFNDSRLSKDFFISRFFKQKPILLITPDWKYYDEIAKEAEEMGGCIEPATTNLFYQIKYIKNKLKVDSIRVDENYPKLIFSKSVKELKYNDSIVFYHTEKFGSSCCPKDPKWEMKGKLDAFISSFEKMNNIKLGNIYKKITGKEGEHILYFTLSNLNAKQKLTFLQEIKFIYFKNAETKDIELSPRIYTPSTINKEGLILVNKE